jgi:hypothetical protein
LQRHKFKANLSALPQQWTALEIWTCYTALPLALQDRRMFADYLKEFVRNPTIEGIPLELLGSSFASFAQKREQQALVAARMAVAAARNAATQRVEDAKSVLQDVVQTPSMTAAHKAQVNALARMEAALQATVLRLEQLTRKAAEAAEAENAKEAANAKKRIAAQQAKMQEQERKIAQKRAGMGKTFLALAALMGAVVAWKALPNEFRRSGWGYKFTQSGFEAFVPPWLQAKIGTFTGTLPLFAGGSKREHQYERQYNRYMRHTGNAAWSTQTAMADLGF